MQTMFPKIAHDCARRYLLFFTVLLLKIFCLKHPQKTETLFGNNNRIEWDSMQG